jgi:hypothetical protein
MAGRHRRTTAAPADARPEVRASTVRPHGIEIIADPPDVEIATDAPTAPGCEAEEPAEYGVRVVWQSEAEKIEAAEFLLATRAAQEARIRATHLEGLRQHTAD